MSVVLARRILGALLPVLLLLAPTSARSAPQEEYVVEFVMPSDKERVWQFVEQLTDLGYPAFMFTRDHGSGQVQYFAQMGVYPDFESADKAARALQDKLTAEYEIILAAGGRATAQGAALPERVAPAPTPEPAPAPQQTAAALPTPKPIAKAATPAAEPKPAAKAPAAQPVRQPTPAPAPNLAAPSGETALLVQLHSFSIKDNALKAAREYKRKGYAPTILLIYDNNQVPWYVVALGRFPDQTSALQAAQDFEAREQRSTSLNRVDASFLQTRVIPYD